MARKEKTRPEPQALNPLPKGTQPTLRSGFEAVAYHIPTAPSTDGETALKTTISLPRHSTWTSGLHFHAKHTEYLRLIKGAIFVELNGDTKFISSLAGGEIDLSTGQRVQESLIIEVPRYARHNWGRLENRIVANRPQTHRRQMWPEDWTEEVVVEEWTDPADISKPLFFWNLNGIITAPSDLVLSKRQQIAKYILGRWWMDLQLFVVFWELDNWPIFINCRKLWLFSATNQWRLRLSDATEILSSFLVLLVAKVVGTVLGLHAVEKRWMPDTLWEEYRRSLPKRN